MMKCSVLISCKSGMFVIMLCVLQILFERVSFNIAELQEAVRIIDKDVPRTNRDLSYYQWVIVSVKIRVCGRGLEFFILLDENSGISDLWCLAKNMCVCRGEGSGNLLVLRNILITFAAFNPGEEQKQAHIRCIGPDPTEQFLSVLYLKNIPFVIQRWVMLRAWMTCAAASWRFLTQRWTLSGVSPATWKDSTKISWLMVCTEK